MSYSFTVLRAETKADAKASAATEFDQVVGNQPIHERDRAATLAVVDAFIDLLAEDETKYTTVSVSGSLSWQGSLEGLPIESVPLSGVSVNVNAYHEAREA